MRCKKLGGREVPHSCHVLNGRKDYCKDFFVTLEAKEVDLEKEITSWANEFYETYGEVERMAKYFFELGIKTMKG